MSSLLFVDASAWIAVMSAEDGYHAKATAIWKDIPEKHWLLLTTNWTLYEALTFLKTKGNRRLSEELWDLSRPERGAVKVLRVSQKLEEAAVRTFFQHKDKLWSVVDCASFHAIREGRCERAFTYDHHFRQASGEFGFELLE